MTWTRTGTAWGFDSDKGIDAFAADAKNPTRRRADWSAGNARAEMPKAASTSRPSIAATTPITRRWSR